MFLFIYIKRTSMTYCKYVKWSSPLSRHYGVWKFDLITSSDHSSINSMTPNGLFYLDIKSAAFY